MEKLTKCWKVCVKGAFANFLLVFLLLFLFPFFQNYPTILEIFLYNSIWIQPQTFHGHMVVKILNLRYNEFYYINLKIIKYKLPKWRRRIICQVIEASDSVYQIYWHIFFIQIEILIQFLITHTLHVTTKINPSNISFFSYVAPSNRYLKPSTHLFLLQSNNFHQVKHTF